MHWTTKIISLIQSYGTAFIYKLYKISLAIYPVDALMEPLTNSNKQAFFKKRLVVNIHGLNNWPAHYKKIVDELQKKGLAETDIFIPYILAKGNEKLDVMVKPILKEISKWAQTSGEKELVLVGISNGGRIARAIETEIGKSDNYGNIKKLRFVSIVGACKGSSLANLANKLGLSWLMPKNISEEMPTDSDRNQRMDREWAEGLSRGPTREYVFFASPHDWHVTNYSSSLMAIDKQNARYAIIPGHGHNSIVPAIAKTVAEVILE